MRILDYSDQGVADFTLQAPDVVAIRRCAAAEETAVRRATVGFLAGGVPVPSLSFLRHVSNVLQWLVECFSQQDTTGVCGRCVFWSDCSSDLSVSEMAALK